MFKKIILLLSFIAVLFLGLVIGMIINSKAYNKIITDTYSDNKLNYTLSLIDNLYVDPVNMDTLTEQIIPIMLEELDPHSIYIPESEMAEANETLDGEFEGIGIMFNMTTDTVLVLNVINGGPSDMAGIKNGDRIMTIDTVLVAGQKVNQNDIVKKLKGPRGTTVNLGIQRQGIEELVPITVTRDKIPLQSLDAAFMLAPKIGFIKLSAFARTSHGEIIMALSELQQQGMEKLIFDIRGNSGGFLDQAIRITNEFLSAGKMIVYTEDKSGSQYREYSDGRGQFKTTELVILIDEGSASSSEILAGAIQDNDRGTIIGRRSYGKGLVQQQIPYGDGSAIRLTIARYYTPTGRSIQKPYDNGVDEYANDLLTRYEHQEFFTADSIQFADSLRFITPAGKIVYGGGGIMPDIFIPMDTTNMTKYYVEVSGKNILYNYTTNYADQHRKKINSIKTIEDLEKFFSNDNALYNNFVNYATNRGVAASTQELSESKELILAQLKAYIGRNTPLQDNAYYSQIYVVDNVLLEALDQLKD